MEKDKKKYHAYLKSLEWMVKREGLFTSRGKRCELCGAMKYIQVHHLTYDNIYNEPLEDLLLVCRDCHKGIHKHGLEKMRFNGKLTQQPHEPYDWIKVFNVRGYTVVVEKMIAGYPLIMMRSFYKQSYGGITNIVEHKAHATYNNTKKRDADFDLYDIDDAIEFIGDI